MIETVFLEFGFNFLCLTKPFIFNLHSERYTVTPAEFTVHRASSAFFTSSVPVACPHLTPQLRRPCAGVSGSVGLASIPSSICFAAGALVCVCPSSLRTAFKLRGLAGAHSRQANASPSEVWEAKASLGPNNQLFLCPEKFFPFRQFLPDSDPLSCVLVFGFQF
ncbi:hypothetical protein TIFTF001_021098 [Ficus carica]|uniref:Uncharacterized protein n=1 Tax=Ficus carica TaxID=3494 RepID=A0AA88AG28_FICCA|nr:hypothetical protein TIFTF001_021098 [Ficus carica]